jgi:hypothetical protein
VRLSPLVAGLLGGKGWPGGPLTTALGHDRSGDVVVAALRRGLSVDVEDQP